MSAIDEIFDLFARRGGEAYFGEPVSQLEHALQGGPMSEADAREFEAMPYIREAVRLRRWDDQAKVIGWKMPGLAQYQFLLEKLAEESI